MITGKSQLFIKYEPSADEVVDLRELGRSLTGFHASLEQVIRSSGIRGEVDIKATKLREGSIVVDLIIEVVNQSGCLFQNAQDLVDFASVVGGEFYEKVNALASEIDDAHRHINDYAAENPVDYDIFKALGWYTINAILLLKFQKILTTQVDGKPVPTKIARKLHKIVKNSVFKRSFRPFVEGQVSEVEVGADKDFVKKAEIKETDFGEYLGEDQRILPEWENGKTRQISGKIVAIQSTRGDSMTFHVNGLPRKISNMVLYPSDDKSTEDYKQFYKQDVTIEAEVYRRSVYQKPRLKIHDIWVTQQTLT